MSNKGRTYYRPTASITRQVLFASAEDATKDTEILREMLCILNADQDLMDFPSICQNLLDMLNSAQKCWYETTTQFTIELEENLAKNTEHATAPHLNVIPWDKLLCERRLNGWIDLLKWIVDSRKKHMQEIEKKYHEIGDKTQECCTFYDKGDRDQALSDPHIYSKSVHRHPLYAMLWYKHCYSADQDHFLLLQAHFLFAFVKMFHEDCCDSDRRQQAIDAYEGFDGPGRLNYPKIAIPADHGCVTMRAIARNWEGKYLGYFHKLNVNAYPDKFAESPYKDNEANGRPTQEYVAQRHQHLRDFILKAYGRKDRHRRQSTRQVRKRYFKRYSESHEICGGLIHHWINEQNEDVSEQEASTVARVVVCEKKSRKQQKSALDLDDDPAHPEETDGDLSVCDDVRTTNAAKAGVPTDAQYRPISMANQMLPMSNRTISGIEAKRLFQYAETQLPDFEKSELSDSRTVDLIAVIVSLTMLSTGRSFSDAKAIGILWKSSKELDSRKIGNLVLKLDPSPKGMAIWSIPVPSLPFQNHPMSHAGTKRPEASEIEVPDYLGVSRFMHLLLRHKKFKDVGVDEEYPQMLFRGIQQKRILQLKSAMIKILKSIFDGETMPFSRISGFLLYRLIQKSDGDITLAALVANPRMALARARLFYACVNMSRIRRFYRELFSETFNICAEESKSTSQDFDDLWIATRPCPTVQAVKEAVREVKRKLNKIDPFRSVEQYIAYHNLYTLYAIWVCAYATAMRPVRTPLLNVEQIEKKGGYARINDKNIGVGYNARLVVIAEVVKTQLTNYAGHRRAVVNSMRLIRMSPERLGILEKGCFLLNEESKGRGGHAVKARIKKYSGINIPLEVSVKTLKPLYEKYIKFPLNIHRRFMSAELLHRNCLPEVVDWWMSHWHSGEEPWSQYSGLSIADYRKNMLVHSRLFKELGFIAKRSKIVSPAEDL